MDSQWFFCSNKFSTVLVMAWSTDISSKSVCAILFGSDKNFGWTHLHKFINKMVSDIYVLCSLAHHEIFQHEDCSDVVDSHYDWNFHWNPNWLHHLHHKLYLFHSFGKCNKFCFAWQQGDDSLAFILPADWYTQQENAEALPAHVSLYISSIILSKNTMMLHPSSDLSITGLIFNLSSFVPNTNFITPFGSVL